jgi:hypothetical protein
VLVVETRGAFRILVGKDVRKRPLGESKLSWEGNNKAPVQEWWRRTKMGLIWLRIGTSGRLL